MKRLFVQEGLKSCWSCGSESVDFIRNVENKDFSWGVLCTECGERTLNCESKEIATNVWNKAYEICVG